MRDTHGNHEGQPFTEIFPSDRDIFEHVILFAITVQTAGQCGSESTQMSSAFVGMNVIRVGANIFSQVCGVLQSQVVTNAILLTLTVNDFLVNCIA